MTNTMTDTINSEKTAKPIWVKLWPIYIILAGLALAISQGWHTQLTPSALGENAVFLNNLVQENFLFVLVAFIAIYILATTFMVPASALTIGGGFLFGLGVGVPAILVGATAGACILFLAAKSSVGEALKSIAGPFVGKMEAGFNESPFSYLFTLRLIPVVPFAVANIAPAILGAKFQQYLIATFFGMIPGTIAYTWIGAGLRGTLLDAAAAGDSIDVGAIVKAAATNMAPAFVALAFVALIPAIYKKFFKKNTPAADA